jgi:hypothetical protein
MTGSHKINDNVILDERNKENIFSDVKRFLQKYSLKYRDM